MSVTDVQHVYIRHAHTCIRPASGVLTEDMDDPLLNGWSAVKWNKKFSTGSQENFENQFCLNLYVMNLSKAQKWYEDWYFLNC